MPNQKDDILTLVITSGRVAHAQHRTPIRRSRVEKLKPGDGFGNLRFMGIDDNDPVYGSIVLACRA